MRFLALAAAVLALIAGLALGRLWLALAGGALTALGAFDLLQRRHSILRNYPIIGHARFVLESIRPELQQYFIERNFDGRPFDRDTRSSIYQRAKGVKDEQAYGTERDVNEVGYEWLMHSTAPLDPPEEPTRVRVGGPDCTQPYDMALLNVSAMSFGALSGAALTALNRGAAAGGFAHDTGEGGLTRYHLEGGDIVWELGSGYFGARTHDGGFDRGEFRDKAAHERVRCVSLKLSQGAKPGIGGQLPGPKVTKEIAEARDVPQGVSCISPAAHRVFSTPRELVRFIGEMRELAGGKPTGFKLCVGLRHELLAICRAMVEEGVTPDFIVVDGAEGGTGAAPMEYEDNVGTPLSEGLMIVHNALVGVGLRDRIRIGASGKIATGTDVVKRLAIGADYTNAARAMMMAVGCIQSQRCHTNTCPVGVATQDPKRALLLMLGTDFPYSDWYPEGKVVVQVDIRGEHIGRRTAVRYGVVGDAGLAAAALLELVQPKPDRSHLEKVTGSYRDWRDRQLELTDPGYDGRGVVARVRSKFDNPDTRIRPEALAAVVDAHAAEDAIFTSDTGMSTVWLSRFVTMRGTRRLIGSYNLGSMANAMPQALGAQALDRSREVVAFCGDGGLTMLLGDLMTAVTHRLPVRFVVFDNGRLGMVKLEQEQGGLPEFGTELANPDLAAVARAMGMHAVRVEDAESLDGAVREAFAHDGPVLLDVITNPDEVSLPPKVTPGDAWGFAVAKLSETLESR